jgi:hypothetical protein
MSGKRYTEDLRSQRSSRLLNAGTRQPRSLNGLASISTASIHEQSDLACPKLNARPRTPSPTRCGD